MGIVRKGLAMDRAGARAGRVPVSRRTLLGGVGAAAAAVALEALPGSAHAEES